MARHEGLIQTVEHTGHERLTVTRVQGSENVLLRRLSLGRIERATYHVKAMPEEENRLLRALQGPRVGWHNGKVESRVRAGSLGSAVGKAQNPIRTIGRSISRL